LTANDSSSSITELVKAVMRSLTQCAADTLRRCAVLTFRMINGKRKSEDNDQDAAKRHKDNVDRLIENDDDEDATKRQELNVTKLIENDDDERKERRQERNSLIKLKTRAKVQEQRAAFHERANESLASLPDDVRYLCLFPADIDDIL
jgi:hypothetical protein